MHNPAYIVEGHMEQLFVQNICPRQPVRLLQCNGEDVAISAIANRVKLQLRFLKNYYPVILVFDRENRRESCDEMQRELMQRLSDMTVDTTHLIVAIADRTTENWILSDRVSLANDPEIDICRIPECVEGLHGKSLIRQAEKDGAHYGETTSGYRLLRQMSPHTVAQNSISFRKFFEKLKFGCWWIEDN